MKRKTTKQKLKEAWDDRSHLLAICSAILFCLYALDKVEAFDGRVSAIERILPRVESKIDVIGASIVGKNWPKNDEAVNEAD
jgi:hypothetical protein